MTISANMYGMDNNELADSISSAALSAPKPSAHNGAAIANDAVAKGNLPDDMDYDGDAKTTSLGTGNDSRAVSKGDCPR